MRPKRNNMYQLKCPACKVDFKPMVCTESGELLYPDYDAAEDDAGRMNAYALRMFHEEHSSCILAEVEL